MFSYRSVYNVFVVYERAAKKKYLSCASLHRVNVREEVYPSERWKEGKNLLTKFPRITFIKRY